MVDVLVRRVPTEAHAGLHRIAAANDITANDLAAAALTLLGLSGGVVVASAGPTTSRFINPAEAINAMTLVGSSEPDATDDVAVRSVNVVPGVGTVITIPDVVREATAQRRVRAQQRVANLLQASASRSTRLADLHARVHPNESSATASPPRRRPSPSKDDDTAGGLPPPAVSRPRGRKT